jgi:hypothetical protein
MNALDMFNLALKSQFKEILDKIRSEADLGYFETRFAPLDSDCEDFLKMKGFQVELKVMCFGTDVVKRSIVSWRNGKNYQNEAIDLLKNVIDYFENRIPRVTPEQIKKMKELINKEIS